jgi:predicted RNase H-like nuclease
MHLIGLDVGFSAKRRTNALAELRSGEIRVVKLSVDERDAELGRLRDVDVIAIDAPLLPSGCAAETPRLVERLFSRGLFQRRCKPGASHVRGTGHLLRAHGARVATAVMEAARWESTPPFPTIVSRCGVVEAFPNAFLGVAMPDHVFTAQPKLVRGKKFDWLYDQWIALDLFSGAVMRCGLPLELTIMLHAERDHEKRAALVCLMTAAFAATGGAKAVGDERTGYFFLPDDEFWAAWSREALPSLSESHRRLT